MADEIRIQNSITINNGNFIFQSPQSQINATQTTKGGGLPGSFIATTAGVSLDTSTLTNEGFIWMRNLDPTNFVQWGPYSGGIFYPIGEMLVEDPPALFRLSPGCVLHFKADTGNCQIQAYVFEK